MSLVLCDIATEQIIFLADSARPTANTAPKDYATDAIKVLLSPNGKTGIGLAGTLNFPWQNTWKHPEKWVDHVLRSSQADEVASPAKIAQTLARKIEALRGVPFNDLGIIMIAGFSNDLPVLIEFSVKSKSQQITDLAVLASTPNESPRLWGVVGWPELLSLTGKSRDGLPHAAEDRCLFLTEVMKGGIATLRSRGEFRVALPLVSIRIVPRANGSPV